MDDNNGSSFSPGDEHYRLFWQYLSQTQKDLIQEGQYLMNDIIKHQTYQFKDYSFLIFPFAKAYEGFLKQVFKDNKFISHLDYISDHLRLGKLLSPNIEERLGDRSLYRKIKQASTQSLADRVWQVWKIGRNEVFHYFPHNIKAVSFTEAEDIIEELIETMQEVFETLCKKA